MLRLLLILAVLAGIVAFLVLYVPDLSEPRARDYAREAVWETAPTTITMLCSDEKEEWIRKAASDFNLYRPDINLKIRVMSSVDGMNALVGRQVTPTLWSPAESAMLEYMRYRWKQEFGMAPFELAGEDAPRSLARSPVVWLSWRSRIDTITAALQAGRIKPESVWADIGCAGVPLNREDPWSGQPARWDTLPALARAQPAPAQPAPAQPAPAQPAPAQPAPAQPAPARSPAIRPPADRPRAEPPPNEDTPISTWGEIKFLHTDPTRSNPGFYAIYLMSYQFMGEPGQVTKPMVNHEQFTTWFRRCQRLRRTFPASVQTLTNRPFQFGPTSYDIVITYENLALRSMRASSNRWSEQPYLYYPSTGLWADHPIVILNSSRLPRDQLEAARDWIAFLLAPDRQRSLISFGLRPTRPRPSLRDQRTENPFIEGTRFGVQLDPKIKSPPVLDGEVVDRLLELWREATGYY